MVLKINKKYPKFNFKVVKFINFYTVYENTLIELFSILFYRLLFKKIIHINIKILYLWTFT